MIRPGLLPCLSRINYFALGFCNYSPNHSKSFRQGLCPLDRLHNNNKAQQRRLPVAASWNGLGVSSCLCLFCSSFCLSVSHSQITDPSWADSFNPNIQLENKRNQTFPKRGQKKSQKQRWRHHKLPNYCHIRFLIFLTFQQQKKNCKRSKKRRSYLETDNNKRVYKFSSATDVSSPFLFFFFFFFFLLAPSSQSVRWVHIKFPKLSCRFPSFHDFQATIPCSLVSSGLCELYQSEWMTGSADEFS